MSQENEMNVKICPTCGAEFSCGSSVDGQCWCNSFPPIFMPDANSSCLCNSCLHQAAVVAIETYVKNITPEQAKELDFKKYQSTQNIEGIDYYLENGNYVFTKWFLLKRGECCKSGCRHCPYGFKII